MSRLSTAWTEAGSGPPVLFLHGLGGARGAWGPQMRELSDQFRCIAWDMPGYGGSVPEPDLSYASIARRIVELLDQLDVAKVDLVGLSFGGMHALHCALRFPERVGRMVLANTSPAFGMDGTDPEEWKAARLGLIEHGRWPADAGVKVIDGIAGSPIDPVVRAELIAAFSTIGVEGFRDAVNCLPTNDIRDQLPALTQRCLVIVGELDQETPIAYAQELAEGLRFGELEILPGVGHLSPSEAPTAFNRLVRLFLSEPAS